MQYTSLGRTGLKVSRLCLGTMNFGPQTSEADSFAIMDEALERGVNFIDTANVYGWKRGEGVTEQIIGRWLAQGGQRDNIVLASKVYMEMGAGVNERGLSAGGPKLYIWWCGLSSISSAALVYSVGSVGSTGVA